MVPVPRKLVKLALCHIGGFGKLPAAARLLILNKTLQNLNYFSALGQHYRQALTYNINGGEKLQLAP